MDKYQFKDLLALLTRFVIAFEKLAEAATKESNRE